MNSCVIVHQGEISAHVGFGIERLPDDMRLRIFHLLRLLRLFGRLWWYTYFQWRSHNENNKDCHDDSFTSSLPQLSRRRIERIGQ